MILAFDIRLHPKDPLGHYVTRDFPFESGLIKLVSSLKAFLQS